MYQHLITKNDPNGNPRRLYVFYDSLGNVAKIIVEGYCGKPKECEEQIELMSVEISPSFYRRLLKIFKEQVKEN